MRYDTILFDLDGTLLDTLDDLTDSLNAVLVKKGYPRRTREEVRAFIGNGLKVLLERALPAGAGEKEILQCLTLMREVYFENMENRTRPYEKIPALLWRLKEMGLKVGVVSNKPDEATRSMCRRYFQGAVDVAIGDTLERKKKPEPDNVYEALKQLNSGREKTLYVGDSDTDMLTAKNAGLVCVGVTWGYRSRELLTQAGADYLIDDPDQLIPLIEAQAVQPMGPKDKTD